MKAHLHFDHRLGDARNLTVIAEGVETAEQLDVLRSIECDEIQGYFLAKPLPPEECAAFSPERVLGKAKAA
ncbi:MAG: EAL domain-containing protein [Pseudomonadota bacterium]